MFKYYLTRASDYIISAKILVLLAIYSVFAIGVKIDAIRSGLSYWEYVLLAMQDMRYISLILSVVFILFLIESRKHDLLPSPSGAVRAAVLGTPYMLHPFFCATNTTIVPARAV